jgi:hypothetical protein
VDGALQICRKFSTSHHIGLSPRRLATFHGSGTPLRAEATVTFQVNIPAVRGLPLFLDRRDGDLRAALSYLHTYAVIQDNSVLYHRMYERHRTNLATISRFLSGAASYVSTDALRVRAAADAYAAADGDARHRNLAALDAALSDFPTDQADPAPGYETKTASVTAALFADSTTPSRALRPVADRSGELPSRPSWSDLLGVASTIRDAIWFATRLAAAVGLIDRPFDPLQLFLMPFVGDWPGLLQSADAFGNVARMLAEESTSIGVAHRRVPTVWTGHASDACQCSLDLLAEALMAASAEIGALATAYHEAGVLLHAAMTAAAATFRSVVDTVSSIDEDTFSGGLLIVETAPNLLIDYARQVTSFIDLAHDVSRAVDAGFPPGDPLAALLAAGEPLVMPDMVGLAGQAEVPLLAAPTTPAAPFGTRRAA